MKSIKDVTVDLVISLLKEGKAEKAPVGMKVIDLLLTKVQKNKNFRKTDFDGFDNICFKMGKMGIEDLKVILEKINSKTKNIEFTTALLIHCEITLSEQDVQEILQYQYIKDLMEKKKRSEENKEFLECLLSKLSDGTIKEDKIIQNLYINELLNIDYENFENVLKKIQDKAIPEIMASNIVCRYKRSVIIEKIKKLLQKTQENLNIDHASVIATTFIPNDIHELEDIIKQREDFKNLEILPMIITLSTRSETVTYETLEYICSITKDVPSVDKLCKIINKIQDVTDLNPLFARCKENIINLDILKALISKNGNNRLEKIDKKYFAKNLNGNDVLNIIGKSEIQLTDDTLQKICGMIGSSITINSFGNLVSFIEKNCQNVTDLSPLSAKCSKPLSKKLMF